MKTAHLRWPQLRFTEATDDNFEIRGIFDAWQRGMLQAGVERGIRKALFLLHELRFGTMPDDLQKLLAYVSEPTLMTLVRLAITGTVGEFESRVRWLYTR